jgi:pimeloyl-ACP methyl ester carboxylesterase
MNGKKNLENPMTAFDWMKESYEYWLDSSQRWILFMDILRKRGNNYFETIKNGEPPVLVFDYEVILEGRTFDRPVNYDLARIKPRKTDKIDPEKQPIIVIDPRAGNGPGIGGSKRDSEIGDALAQGYPVYFILFHPEPEPGQTVDDVEKAEIRFVEEVARRHPKAERPALIGNCQAGWAVALLGADRPDLTGPLVLNGSPLSYWSGVQGKNPMRYAGGLLGGIWLISLLSDLGHGKFDGAWLEENFESLNPGNTLWTKQYNLYSNVDTDEDRYLTFEKWWDGYSDYDVRFEERDIKDLMALNEGKEEMEGEDADFSRVATISEMNDRLYNTFASPLVKMLSTETSAEVMKQLHPLRVNKYIFSDTINPFMLIFKTLAPFVKKDRSPVSPDNPFTALEKSVSDSIVTLLDGYQNIRDHFEETLFFTIYENPWMKLLFPETSPQKPSP